MGVLAEEILKGNQTLRHSEKLKWKALYYKVDIISFSFIDVGNLQEMILTKRLLNW